MPCPVTHREPVMRLILLLWAAAALSWGATPDQVLVLYNADWTEDLDGSEPGQDSLEVARYYIEQRTDPGTGKKPYVLGLHCADPKAKRLNEMRLPEGSQDNRVGIRSKKGGTQPDKPPYSATLLATIYKQKLDAADRACLTIRASATGKEEDAAVIYGDGGPKPGYNIQEVQATPGLAGVGFADRKSFPDGFTAWIDMKPVEGRGARSYSGQFAWPDQFEPDTTGPDNIRDDANYLADVETPIKRFLEDPKNALPDGTLLRDHVLCFAICYGLPKQVEASFGVSRGVRGNCAPGDDGSSLESRLQLLYHNVARYHQVVVLPWGSSKMPTGRIASRLRGTLVGANPFRHPLVHQRRKPGGLAANRLYKSYDYDAPRIPHFTTVVRRRLGDGALYLATRLDGRHPEIAKAQVDGALYGERHLTPFLGWFWHGTYASAEQAAEELTFFEFRDQPPETPKPHERGRVLFYFGDFGYGTVLSADPAKPAVPYTRGFYPGSVGYAVRSGLGWQLSRRVSQLYDGNSAYLERMLDAGATCCALSAHGAHDTNATWPDDQVLFHHLLRGYTLGECLLFSAIYLDWVQSHVGDPLYSPDLRLSEEDKTPPKVASRDDIAVELGKADGRYWARIRPRLIVSRENPEMADIAVTWWRDPDAKQTAEDWRFSRRPRVVLPILEPESTYHIDVVLTDPYGNRFSSAQAFGDITITTGAAPPAKHIVVDRQGQDDRRLIVRKPGETKPLLPERGELHVEFTPQGPHFRLLEDDRRRFLLRSQGLTVGGRVAACCVGTERPPRLPFEGGRRYRLIARWRRDPVVRQVVLVARDGREFLLGSNNRLCWLPDELGTVLLLRPDGCTIHRVTLFDDTRPQPLDPLYPAPFDLDGFLAADGAKKQE